MVCSGVPRSYPRRDLGEAQAWRPEAGTPASVSSGPEAVSEPSGVKEKSIKDAEDKSSSRGL